jgi:hypothetical protein
MAICRNPECGAQFEKTSNRKVYCKPTCQEEHYYVKTRAYADSGLTRTTVGDIGELRVGVDLLARGYDVFKSLCGNCWTDLIVAIDGKLLSVQVRTGRRTSSGTLMYPKDKEHSDMTAVVLPNEIVYLPPLP